MTTGSHTIDTSHTHPHAAMPPKYQPPVMTPKPVRPLEVKVEDAKKAAAAIASNASEFRTWSTLAMANLADIDAINQAVEVAGAECLGLGEEGGTLLEKSQRARLALATGLVNSVPTVFTAAQKLAKWTASSIEKPVATISEADVQAMKAKIEELTKALEPTTSLTRVRP